MDIIRKNKEPKFLDIKARLFQNKSNGQFSISIPKKRLRKMVGEGLDNPDNKLPKKIPVRIFWGNK